MTNIAILIVCFVTLIAVLKSRFDEKRRRNIDNKRLVELGKRYTYEREMRKINDRKVAQLQADKKILTELLDEKLKVVYSDGTTNVSEMVKFIAVKEG